MDQPLLLSGKVGHRKQHKKNRFMLFIFLLDFLFAILIALKAI